MKKKRTNPSKTLPATIVDLRASEFNPRTITADALEGLQASVVEFGDIGGIVFNTRLGCLVAGHQRVAALRSKYGEALTVVPDGFGNGRIDTPAGPFGVRFVDWDDVRTHAAMMVANNPSIQGDWTDAAAELLERLKGETGDLFAEVKLDALLGDLQKTLEGATAPGEFPVVGVDLVTHYQCPRCAYKWSGKPKDNAAENPTSAPEKKRKRKEG